MACAWKNFKIIFSRPLFIITFRTKILFSGPYSILTGHTKVESVAYQVLIRSLANDRGYLLYTLQVKTLPVQAVSESKGAKKSNARNPNNDTFVGPDCIYVYCINRMFQTNRRARWELQHHQQRLISHSIFGCLPRLAQAGLFIQPQAA